MGDKENGNGRDPRSLIVPSQAIEYVMGGIKLGVNMHPVHVVTSPEFANAGGWDGSPQALAVFMAATMEISELRSQINHLTKIVERLTRVVPDWFEGVVAGAAAGGVEGEGAERVEPDPEEAERDYSVRLCKVSAHLVRMNMTYGELAGLAGLHATATFAAADGKPNLADLRKMECWLNQHGGTGWLSQDG